MGWFRVEDGCLHYRGLTRGPFAGWLETAAGKATVAAVGATIGFALFGRRRAARRVLWQELQATASSERVQSVVREQALAYHTLLASLAFIDALPRATVDLRRVVIVPRLLLNAFALRAMRERLCPLLDGRDLLGGKSLRDFFITTLVDEMDRALVFARPTIRRPLQAHEQWASVAVDFHFLWDAPDWSGPTWPGHHYVYEQPRGGLTRRQRNHLNKAIEALNASMARWPRPKRHDTLRQAVATLGA